MSGAVEVPEDLAEKAARRMEWAAQYIGEAGGRGHTADRVKELRACASQLRSLVIAGKAEPRTRRRTKKQSSK